MKRWIAGIFLTLSLAGCRREPQNARIDAAIAPLIPGDSVALAGLRLDRLQDTPFFRTYVQGKKIQVLEQFQALTGLDANKDIWEVVWAVSPNRMLVFVRGKFGGQFGLEPKFDVPDLQRTNHKGYYILHKGEQGVLFMNSGVAVAGKVDDLKAVVDDRDKAGAGPPQALVDMVKTLPADHLWVVTQHAGSLIPKLPTEGNFVNAARMASSLGVLTLHADLSKGLNLDVLGEYPDPVLAKQVQDTVRGLVGMLRLQTKDEQADLLKALDAVQIQARDRQVTISVVAPFELIEQVTKSLAIFSPRGSRPPDSSTPRPR
jgi:hypothetical protein